ncbi:hypothetical protein NKH93_10890 [Mesorhizobium sp. M0954]|uniref:hypothetical protein n=1 Tax=Mesorhizobium sp. M0954 TaxID=2957032 RepID=UPI0033391AF1
MSFLGLPECASFPVRNDPPNVLEYTAAEWWVRECYASYFRGTLPVPQLITWQLQRFFFNYDPLDPVLELVMTVLERDFRNVLNPRLVKQFMRLVKAQAPHTELLALLKEITPGGARKPDMLGISASRNLVFDGVEVGTVKTAQSTWDELNEKLTIIKDVIVPQLKIEMPQLAIRMSKGFQSFSVPLDYTVKGSAFRMTRWQRVLPLPVRISGKGNARSADWICFHPSMTWQPAGAPPAGGGGEPQGSDGLFLYHIHRATLPNLPEKVRQNLEQELRRWRQGHGLVLELNPAYAFTFQQSKSDWSPEAKMLFGYLGLGALVVMGVALAWELGLVAGAVMLAEEGLLALAATPQVFITAMAEASALARFLWPIAVSAAQWLPAK